MNPALTVCLSYSTNSVLLFVSFPTALLKRPAVVLYRPVVDWQLSDVLEFTNMDQLYEECQVSNFLTHGHLKTATKPACASAFRQHPAIRHVLTATVIVHQYWLRFYVPLNTKQVIFRHSPSQSLGLVWKNKI